MAWLILILAGILEIVWAFAMKRSQGFTHLAPTIIMAVAMLDSIVLLASAMRTLPLGTAYTVWTGIGAEGSFVIGIVALGEEASLMRVSAAVLIVAGLILMKLSSNA